MKKIGLLIGLLIVLAGWTVTSDTKYVRFQDMNTNTEWYLYFTDEQAKHILIDEEAGTISNNGSGSMTVCATRGGVDVSCTFPLLSDGYYRYNQNYNTIYEYFDNIVIVATNIDSSFNAVNVDYIYMAFLGGMLVCSIFQLIKRS